MQRDGAGCLHSNKIKQIDQFGENIGFNFSAKSTDFRSWVGSMATCIVLMVTLVVTVQNGIRLQKRGGTIFTSALKAQGNEDYRIFSEKDGFQLAFAILDTQEPKYIDSSEEINIDEYLTINVTQKHVDYEARPDEQLKSTELALHRCSDQELGLDDSGNSKFYPVNKE